MPRLINRRTGRVVKSWPSNTKMTVRNKKNYRRKYRLKTGFKSTFYGMPKQKLASFKYCDTINLTPGATVGSYRFSANGMYDPNITGTGHQPLGFDQLMAFYDQYTIIASKIHIKWLNQNSNPLFCGLFLNDDTTTIPVSQTDFMEQTNSKYAILTPPTGSQDILTQKGGFSAKKDLGISKPLSASQLLGTASTNPSEQMYYELFYYASGDTTANSIKAYVTITYIAVLTERKDLIAS